ncbi:MAG: hypothetical protein ACTSVI_07495 [Promethearchaeota archaeon]
MSDMQKQIKDFLKEAKEWEKLPTEQLPGVHIVKMPATKTRPAKLAIEINPIKDGKPLKRKGLFVTSIDMLLEFSEILQNESVYNLMKVIDGINAEQEPKSSGRPPLKIE